MPKHHETEFSAECPKCRQNYSGDTFWKVCPICAGELTNRSARRCDPPPRLPPRPKVRKEFEKVYNSADVARMTGFSIPTIKRMFKNEPGVILLERPTKMNKRRYCNIRIPLAVYERVMRRITVPEDWAVPTKVRVRVRR